ncbi:hypothetical protein [Streptomyces phaeofaciens]|uniref:hypothetical protein n=1 Tax=Streptomyces phaeofaciens TaxID=68254 RepID=UPI0036C98437
MHINRTSAEPAGDHGARNNTHLPPPPGTHHATSQSVTAGDNARITQKNTQVKFSIPVVGPLLTMAWAHPLIAGVAAVALVGGGGAAISLALPDSTPSPSTELVRGFVMKTDSEKAPTGYDFTHTPPRVADSGTDAVYVQGNSLFSTSGKMALLASSEAPTAQGCRDAVTESPQRQIFINVSSLVCYLDRNGDPGYISVTAFDTASITVDTAHLR